jgi:cellulose synthase operon protein C
MVFFSSLKPSPAAFSVPGLRALSAAALLLAAMLSGGAAHSASAAISKLPALVANVQNASEADAYAALRAIWQVWDYEEPASVDAALEELSTSRSLRPATRVYAGLLHAYARRRFGDVAEAQRIVKSLGFVSTWAVVGPFDNEGKQGFDQRFEVEGNRSFDFSEPWPGKERPVRFRLAPNVAGNGWLDLGSMLRPQENICAYAVTLVREKSGASKPISIWAGAAGALKVFFNGREVIRDNHYRSLDADRFSASVTLERGWNRVLTKVCGAEGGALLTLRVAGADGSPDASLETAADPALSKSDAATRAQISAQAAGSKNVPKMGGPIAAFEARGAAGNEAYARYLVATAGDDPAEHRARDLATKAAQGGANPLTLLLAGELAEDRNQRGQWIQKAEARVGANAPLETRLKVLLARAAFARAGVNWRECIPLYEKVLTLDPDNVPALLARVELYGEAGLRETAIKELEKALTERPRSVSILRTLAGALRDAGRTREANELMDRYAQLRFDDTSFVRSQLDLSLARRSPADVKRWLGRLTSLESDEVSTYQLQAKTYLALGDQASAIAAYRKAQDLAPEDTDTIRALSDLLGTQGKRDEQAQLLRKILELKPQSKDVREYLAQLVPQTGRKDEAYAVSAKEFLKDREAPAAGQTQRKLVDLQVTTVFPNGLSSRFHQVVIQPLTEQTAAEAREYAFGYEGDTETVQLRGARVHRKNGQVEEAVETGEAPSDNPGMVMYTSGRVYFVHFPRLYPGDVIEIQYRVEDVAERNAFADYFGEVNYMQGADAVSHAEYVLVTPKSRAFYFNQPNVPGLTRTTEERGNERIYRFVAKNVPGVVREPLEPPMGEHLGYVHVSTYKSWDEMGRWYWGLVKDQFATDDEVKKRALEATKGLTDERAKVRAIYGYVVQKTRYVALEFGIHGFKPYRCAQIFARGFGDCKDKATLIVSMLREVGIPATIVIVRTNMRGDFGSEPASLAPFDHAIAYVPSLQLFLDGTAENTGSTELPAMDRGAIGLLINEGKRQLVRLPEAPASESVTAQDYEIALAADGSAGVNYKLHVSGVHASRYRQRYQGESTRSARLSEDIAGTLPGFEAGPIQTNKLDDIEVPVDVSAKGKVRSFARVDGDRKSFAVTPRDFMVKQLAPLSARKRDIRFLSKTTDDDTWTFTLPAGHKLAELPRAASGKTQFGEYAVSFEQKERQLRVTTHIAIEKTRITPQEYAEFRAFCENVDKALNQRVTVTP